MGFFFLASISGLFPGLTLPLALGWKEIHAFDLAFLACTAFAMARGALRRPDWRLIAAGLAFIGAAVLALWAHPSPEGVRAVSTLAYSMAVLLTVSHIRIDALGIRLDRVILWPLFLAIGIAGVIFLIENVFGIPIGSNRSAALPANVYRLGGFTGANALILFLCLAAPLAQRPGWILGGILLPALITLSRSMLGVGTALVILNRSRKPEPCPTRRAILVLSWLCVTLGLFAYAFAVVPVQPSARTTLRMSFEPGGYLTPHQAALRMLWSSPLVGVGPARFVEEFQRFSSSEERDRLAGKDSLLRAPHSAVLGLAAEQGLLSLAAFAWLILEIYKRLGRTRGRSLRSAATAGLTGLLVGGHFVDWLALKGLWFWMGLLVARSFATTSPVGPNPEGSGAGEWPGQLARDPVGGPPTG